MNVYDTLMLEDIIRPLGFRIVSSVEEADMIVLNTCHIREKASEKLYSTLGRIKKLRKDGCLVVVAGCVAQAEGEVVFERAPFVNIVVGPQSIHTLPDLIMRSQRESHLINLDFPPISKFDAISLERYANRGVSAFVSVQEGCDKFCTYCVVPYTRGPEYSRTIEEVLNEVRTLADHGTKEIVLIGQNVSAYRGSHKGTSWDLGMLIQEVAEVRGIERIRYTTSHPMDMHQSLYDAHKNVNKLMPLVHLPLQSGSNKILRTMNRKHTAADYLSIIDTMRSTRKDIAFSSDFIVGFPGETEEDFADTMNLVRKVGFAMSYSFKYSPRPGTPGAEYKHQVPEEEKSRRLIELQKLLFEQQLCFNKKTIGQVIPVLVGEEKGRFENQIVGKSPHMQPVHANVRHPQEYFNKIIDIKIRNGGMYSLEGELAGCDVSSQSEKPEYLQM